MTFDEYKDPKVFQAITMDRLLTAQKLSNDPQTVADFRLYYKDNPWDFCRDWIVTYDPRAIRRKQNPYMPFIPFKRQVEFMHWVHERLEFGEPGITVKSRECGVSWLCAAYAVSMFLFNPGSAVLFATRKEDELDVKGNASSLFEKMRIILDRLPFFWKPDGFIQDRDCKKKEIINPETGSTISGMCGDELGRGWRGTIAFIDEAAFIEHQEAGERALSQSTETRIRVSTPNVVGDNFHRDYRRWKKEDPRKVFEFNWRDDPRKNIAWYHKQVQELEADALAKEVDMSFEGANEDAFLPDKWVNACVDAHKQLGFEARGDKVMGFDPADVGHANAICIRKGSVATIMDQVKGTDKKMDISGTVPWAIGRADDEDCDGLIYDADGMGGIAIKMVKHYGDHSRVPLIPHRGSASVKDPEALVNPDDERSKTNKDTYYNRRAQEWSKMRQRMQRTYQAVQSSKRGHITGLIGPEELISIDSNMEHLDELKSELSAPQRKFNTQGKIQVEGKVDMKKRGVDSPNLADAFIYAFADEDLGHRNSFADDLHWEQFQGYDPAAGF